VSKMEHILYHIKAQYTVKWLNNITRINQVQNIAFLLKSEAASNRTKKSWRTDRVVLYSFRKKNFAVSFLFMLESSSGDKKEKMGSPPERHGLGMSGCLKMKLTLRL